jgi:Tol biopolymer transport system component
MPLLLLATTARADFTQATLLSGTAQLQFDQADAPALSRDGRYVAFQGSLAGISGVWRRDLESGAIEPVAVGEPGDPAISAPDAAGPSISETGRYIAFTTTADLEPEHTPVGGAGPEGEPAADVGCPEVYVRDMDLPASAPGAYTLASALDGGEGIVFAGSCPSVSEGFAIAGAQAAPGVALSADGRSVAFTVLSPSDLATGPAGATTTPASQVAVHDIEPGGTTTLVSVTPEGQPTPDGGAFPSTESEQYIRVGTAQSNQMGDDITGSTAAISGDGTTVAWLGTDVPAQVPGSGPEIEAGIPESSGRSAAAAEIEPLWRRIADGSAASTRRLLAGAGLDLFYYRDEDLEIVQGGSFVDTGASPVLFLAPALSEDGQSVAVISNAPRPAALDSAELYEKLPQTDAYLVRVQDDPAVTPQVTPLTETPDYDTTTGAYGFVKDIAISPDGSRVAFEAERTQFTLPALALVSPPATTRLPQTYEANVGLGTLQRVTSTYDGAEPVGGSAGLLSFSSDGETLAFASTATNLFYGDAVNASQVYLTEELPSQAQVAAQQPGSMPIEPLPSPAWRLDTTAVAQADGSVLVYAQAPGAGELEVQASAQLPVPRKASPPKGGKADRARAEKPTKTAPPELRSRTVAHAATAAHASSELRLRLRVGAGYRALVTGKDGLYAILRVTFAAPGHVELVEKIPVTFRQTLSAKHARVKAAGKAKSKVKAPLAKSKDRTAGPESMGKAAARRKPGVLG